MGAEHTWTPEEELAWRTWELPDSLRADALHNLKEIEAFVRSRGYIVEHGLLDMLGNVSSDLRPRLRFSQPPSHSLANALVDALTARPPAPPEPQPYAGSELEKLIGTGVDIIDQPLSVKDKAATREQIEQDHKQAVEELRKAKEQIEEQHYKTEAEALSVNNRSGTALDHSFCDLLKQICAKRPDGSISWVHTYQERLRFVEEHRWRLEHGLPTSPHVPLNRF